MHLERMPTGSQIKNLLGRKTFWGFKSYWRPLNSQRQVKEASCRSELSTKPRIFAFKTALYAWLMKTLLRDIRSNFYRLKLPPHVTNKDSCGIGWFGAVYRPINVLSEPPWKAQSGTLWSATLHLQRIGPALTSSVRATKRDSNMPVCISRMAHLLITSSVVKNWNSLR